MSMPKSDTIALSVHSVSQGFITEMHIRVVVVVGKGIVRVYCDGPSCF